MKLLMIIWVLAGVINSDSSKPTDKVPVRIYLEHFRNKETVRLSARVLTKKDKRYRPAEGVEVILYISELSPENLLGKIITAEKGIGTYTLTQTQYDSVKNKKIVRYIGVVNENDTLQRKKTEITIKDVNLSIRFDTENSVKMIYAHVSETDSTGGEIPQSGVEIKFLVERPLSPLPIGDEYITTNENGDASVEFPDDLPGDQEGNLKIMVRIAENENYGTVEVSHLKPWGVPTYIDEITEKRSLWASGANAPIPLLIFINSLIAGVWGIILYILFKILKIRKIGQ